MHCSFAVSASHGRHARDDDDDVMCDEEAKRNITLRSLRSKPTS
jgi:hypothetical protein